MNLINKKKKNIILGILLIISVWVIGITKLNLVNFFNKICTIVQQNNLYINNNINYLDFSSRSQIGFQDAATSLMHGIINLHHHIFFFITIIVIFVFVIFYKTYDFSVWKFDSNNGLNYTKTGILNNYNTSKNLINKLNISSHLNVTHGTILEVVWTILPSFVLLFIVGPSFTLLYAIDAVADPDCTVKVIGHQWYWSYEYSDELEYGEELDKDGNTRVGVLVENGQNSNVALPPKSERISAPCLDWTINYWWFNKDLKSIMAPNGSSVAILDWNYDSYMTPTNDLKEGELRLLEVDNPLYLPVGHNVRLHITSDDVLHAFAVPSLGVKVDAVPGRLNVAYVNVLRKGIFFGQCSELCGVNHGYMPIKIVVLDMEKWVDLVIWGSAENDGLIEFKNAELGENDEILSWVLKVWTLYLQDPCYEDNTSVDFAKSSAIKNNGYEVFPLNWDWLIIAQAWYDHLKPNAFMPGVWV